MLDKTAMDDYVATAVGTFVPTSESESACSRRS